MITACGLLVSCRSTDTGAETKPAQSILSGVYHYHYPHNTKDLVEDHYMVIEADSGTYKGRYYGTSDLFDDNREGYLPGFFVTGMKGFRISGDTISFGLELSPSDLFSEAVPLSLTSGEEGRRNGLGAWEYTDYLDLKTRLAAQVKGDSITFTGKYPGSDRVFVKVSK